MPCRAANNGRLPSAAEKLIPESSGRGLGFIASMDSGEASSRYIKSFSLDGLHFILSKAGLNGSFSEILLSVCLTKLVRVATSMQKIDILDMVHSISYIDEEVEK